MKKGQNQKKSKSVAEDISSIDVKQDMKDFEEGLGEAASEVTVVADSLAKIGGGGNVQVYSSKKPGNGQVVPAVQKIVDLFADLHTINKIFTQVPSASVHWSECEWLEHFRKLFIDGEWRLRELCIGLELLGHKLPMPYYLEPRTKLEKVTPIVAQEHLSWLEGNMKQMQTFSDALGSLVQAICEDLGGRSSPKLRNPADKVWGNKGSEISWQKDWKGIKTHGKPSDVGDGETWRSIPRRFEWEFLREEPFSQKYAVEIKGKEIEKFLKLGGFSRVILEALDLEHPDNKKLRLPQVYEAIGVTKRWWMDRGVETSEISDEKKMMARIREMKEFQSSTIHKLNKSLVNRLSSFVNKSDAELKSRAKEKASAAEDEDKRRKKIQEHIKTLGGTTCTYSSIKILLGDRNKPVSQTYAKRFVDEYGIESITGISKSFQFDSYDVAEGYQKRLEDQKKKREARKRKKKRGGKA